ncbi:MAG: class I SAM-dependent methyltransferase [Opitutaceae bacterium]|nr:class I SAM-dependent methyltransferase [Opitutaceae bacterium]
MSAPGTSPFRRWWWRQLFTPGPWGLLVNPFYHARRGLHRALAEFFPGLRGRVLDVGCGRKPYRHLVPAAEYLGLELDTPELRGLGAADLYYEGGRFPVPDASFDAVICSQVLEHVFTPVEFLGEIRRVLRPGGRLLLTTPFAWDEHSQPHDYGRYSSFGLAYLLRTAGYTIVAQRKTCADGRALVQLGAGYLYKLLHGRSRALNLLVQLLLLAPLNLLGGALAWVLPGNPDLYLDNVVLAEKPATSEATA